jgi:hypothetical protein
MHRYECWIIRRYLANALKRSRLGKSPRSDADVFAWIDGHARLLGLPALPHRSGARGRERFDDRSESARAWKIWRSQAIALAREPAPHPSPLQRRIDWVADACSLAAPQRLTLGLFARIAFVAPAGALVAAINDRLGIDMDAPAISELRPCLEAGLDVGDIVPKGVSPVSG